MVKLDFTNAFNSLRRDCMLDAVSDLCPSLYPLVFSAYSSSSSLFWEEDIIHSQGVQQGDPLGPPLFSLTLHQFLVDSLRSDIFTIRKEERIGLHLNPVKSEIISDNPSIVNSVTSSLPGATNTSTESAILFGSLLGVGESLSTAINENISTLSRVGERLCNFSLHDSIILLQSSFFIPRLMFLLRTAPSFLSSYLSDFDSLLCSTLSSLLNVPLYVSDIAWTEASLPVRRGGLGFRSAVQLATSCYISSAADSSSLVSLILHDPSHSPHSLPLVTKAKELWSCASEDISPSPVESESTQKAWDNPQISASFHQLLSNAEDDLALARLIAVSSSESGAWLQALLISSLGLRLEDCAIKIGVALRLRLQVCVPHTRHHCGAMVDKFGLHGLSCKKGLGAITDMQLSMRWYTAVYLQQIFLPVCSGLTGNFL
uniref:Reverse transcriptase domain-containing protein n=1 Tax=Amphimedon queenslandica TaxID=400682 RepID=A0A1X7UJY5_AMPQE